MGTVRRLMDSKWETVIDSYESLHQIPVAFSFFRYSSCQIFDDPLLWKMRSRLSQRNTRSEFTFILSQEENPHCPTGDRPQRKSMNRLRSLFSRGGDGVTTSEDLSRVATKPTEETLEEPKGKKEHDYSEYGLPSPPRGEHPQTPAKATENMIQDGFRKYTKKVKLGTDKSKVLYFLYGRGFFFGPPERKDKIESILRDEEALQRAVRLVSLDGDRDVTSEFQNQYRTLCQTLKGYFAQPGAFGIHLPTTENEKILQYYFRFQKQGNCFLLAPCLAVGYLRCSIEISMVLRLWT